MTRQRPESFSREAEVSPKVRGWVDEGSFQVAIAAGQIVGCCRLEHWGPHGGPWPSSDPVSYLDLLAVRRRMAGDGVGLR